MTLRRRTLLALPAALVATPSLAQTKVIHLVVPFPAGGATDLFARALSNKLGEALGTTVVVDNRPGAGGAIGSDQVAKAAPDGNTLLLATTSTHAIGPAFTRSLPYDAVRDFTPIGHVGDAPSVMLVPTSSPAKTVREWIDHAKRRPGQLNYASSGNGTIVQLTAELFKAQAGIFVTHIPYKGTALAIPDLASGKVDVLFDSLPTGMPHVRDGRLRAPGITSLQRSPLAPELPPIADTLPGFESNTWFGLYGPRGLPTEVVQRVNAAANRVLSDPEMRAGLARLGITPATGSPSDFARLVAADSAKWRRIIVERRITPDG